MTQAQPFVPADVGTTVNGYQDDFDGASLASGWQVRGANVFSVSGGMLHVTSTIGDPNHLLYEAAGYNNSVQEVLARIRVTSFGTGDPSRAGISTAVDSGTSQGINLLFRDEPLAGQRHIEFLDDALAWGTEFPIAWQNSTWYWLRLRHEPNAASQGGVNDVFGKIWLADGSQAEPASWQTTYDYIPARTARTGFAGIGATSLGGTAEFDVDYILIKASGLPSTVVAPNSFVQTPVTITNQPQSQTVLQCRPVTFSVGYSGTPPFTFQWQRDGVAIPNATNSSYVLSNVQVSDSGAAFRVVVGNTASNIQYSVTSSNAILTASADNVSPMLLGAANNGLNQILVTFSEPVTASTATNRFNYSITNAGGPLEILGATLAGNQTNVTLVTTGQVEGVVYTLTVNGITDQCTSANMIAANSQATFVALAYTSQDIGSPAQGGSAMAVSGGYNVTGGGADIGGTSDQFQFSYQERSGDFDLKARIGSLAMSDAWAEAGLMARESLAADSRFVGTMATPTISGSYFQSRSAINGPTTPSGSFPVNYPNTWLRLRRTGNQFSGYASFDGQSWTPLGSANIAMPANIYFGFAVSSHKTNQTTTAAFRDLSAVTSTATNVMPPAIEPLGQSSRRTSLVISEIMYNPLDRPDGRNVEFVELFNSLSTSEDISGWRLDGDADFVFPPNTIIPAGGFLVVAQVPADVESVYGISGVLGPFSNTNSLPNDRGTIQLRNRIGAVFLEANYDTESPWPIAADGAGHSLVLARPSYGEGNVEAWAASDSVGGLPGRLDPVTVDSLRHVVINEFLAHTDEPDLDFIELYNHNNQPADISGCYLSDDRNTNKFTIPPNTILPPRGFVSFNQNQLGFALSSDGERIYFRNAANTRVLDAVRFEAQANGISSGRYPDGALNGPRASAFSELAARTPGTNNSALLIRDIAINEIMYHPISGDSDDEFIELYNRGSNSVNLAGWRLSGGISFTFPPNTHIPADGYLVIARNAARLISRYPGLNANNTLGDYGGSLANGGERIALAMADPSVTTNNNVVSTNFNYVVVDEVTYRDGGRWGQWSDGGGSSLELIDARGDNRLAPNWVDSDETGKASWTTVSVPGVLDNGVSAAPPDQLQVLLQGPGECLIDNVEVLTVVSSNLIANSTFESGATGWTAEGTQEQSSWETTEGFSSARSYHVRATDRGDNQVNRIRTPLTSAQSAGVTLTIRAKVRWLRGHPEILFRLRGNWLEAAVAMDLPTNLGTPGARNSRAVTNAPPAIYDVTHYPPVPATNQPVVVTARVHDPDGLSSVQLRYRIDPSATLTTVAMVDDGTGGDAVAGDGVFSAIIPGQNANTLVAFRVQATDGISPGATSTFPNNAPTRECLVRFGESVPSGSFPSYRIWMTQASFNAWDARNNLNNTLNDVTFVLGNHRVIYNVGAVYAGSPYIAPGFNTPTGSRCGYAIEIPPDDRFLGDAALQIDWPGGHGNENTAIQEQMAYYITDQIDIAYSHRYFIRLTVNGVIDMQRNGGVGTVFEGVIQPGADFLEQWSPGNSEGDFYRIDRAFEFNDTGGLIGGSDPEPQLRIYTTPDLVNGGTKKKTEKYRWYWLKRAFQRANDFTSLFVLADALNAPGPEPYTSQTEALADVEQWMAMFAVEHIINNFDSWGHDIGKNMYMFLPPGGRAQLYMYDLDWLMLVSATFQGGIYGPSNGPLFISDDPTVTRMYTHPPFRRAYFRAVQDAVDKAFVTAKYEAVMDAKYNALVANGIIYCDGQALAAPTAVKTWFSQRRSYLVSQLATVAAPFAISGTNNFNVTSNLVTLSGTAPITIKTIEVNGVAWPVTWTTVSNWTMRVPLAQATNVLTLLGYDLRGNRVAGASNQVTVVYDGTVPEAAGAVVINEIMYNPRVPDAEFVELFNTATNFAFDLGGWKFNGLDYTFPEGGFITPRSFLVLVKDRTAAAVGYGTNFTGFDAFNGNLQADGETLTLIKPGAVPELDQVIDKVRYEAVAPWPVAANGTGPSLQLTDASQDNARASNWSDGSGWRFFSTNGNVGTLPAPRLYILLNRASDLFIDNIFLVAGSVPEAGPNLLSNGDFESALSGPWGAGGSHAQTAISADVKYAGNSSLHIIATAAGTPSTNNSVWQDVTVVSNTTYTLSYWYLNPYPTNNLTTRLNSTFRPENLMRPVFSTPGAVNSTATPLLPYPTLWINEIQPENISGITDNNGQRDPWLELYNAGTNGIALDGFYLANNYTNLAQWSFPAGTEIEAGEFKVVFVDEAPGQSTASELHTSFRLSAGSGSVVLSRLYGGAPQVLDYVNYSGVSAGNSYGSFPDGQPFDRQEFHHVTAGGTNDGSAAPLRVFINEWMASNTGFIRDPADNAADDWFEIYNPGITSADLAGYFLTDNLTNKFQYEIPAGYAIPPGGFLLVWADNTPNQNSTNRIDLHANFALSRDGEAIGLFAADGTQLDAVTFGAQTNNISQGRYPNGGPNIYFMPTPTPRSANIIPGGNTAPTLAPIGNKTVHQGQTLSFIASATDADSPAQTLTFSLDPGGPPGAAINAGSGVFTWSTTGVSSPSTNTLTVRVTDNGSPPLSDFETVALVVIRPPSFNTINRAGDQLTLGWQTIQGRSYRVEYSDNLSSGNWQPLGPDTFASGNSLSVTVSLTMPAQRFFRIVAVQ